MPQRFLRPGITTSERWNAVSWTAQSLYIRVLTLVDDYGRCDGRASVIHGQCFSVWDELHPDDRSVPQRTAALLHELAAAKLVELYEVDGKKVLQVTQWQERIREGAREKWPKNTNPQDSAAERSVPLPPTPPPPPPPSSTPTPTPPPPVGVGVCALTELKGFGAKLMALYNRPATGSLTSYEESLAAAILRERAAFAQEFETLRAFKSTVRHFPQSLTKLLEGWQEQLDRVANQPKNPEPKKETTNGNF